MNNNLATYYWTLAQNQAHVSSYLDSINCLKEKLNQNWLSANLESIRFSQEAQDQSSNNSYALKENNFHPLCQLIYVVDCQLRNYFEKKMCPVTTELAKLAKLGHDIRSLSNQSIGEVNSKIKLFQSKDHSLYEKAEYEINIAAQYAKAGHSVKFIPENTSDLKTPDLLIDGRIEIECKKKDAILPINRSNSDASKIMMARASRYMDYSKVNYCLIVRTNDILKLNDLEIISEKIRDIVENKKEGNFECTNDIAIEAKLLFPFNKVYQTPNRSAYYNPDFGMLPEFNFPNDGIPLSKLMSLHQYSTSMQIYAKDNFNHIHMINYRIFGFKFGELPKRSIITNIKKATKQLSGNRPGIIYIDLTGLNKNWNRQDLQNLEDLFNEYLRANSRISALVVTTSKESSTELKQWLLLNKHAKNPLPNGFQVPNISKFARDNFIAQT